MELNIKLFSFKTLVLPHEARFILNIPPPPFKTPFILKPGGEFVLFLKKYLANYRVHFINVKIL